MRLFRYVWKLSKEYNDKYEITYTSLQQITVKDIEKKRRINIKTDLSPETLKVDIKNNF